MNTIVHLVEWTALDQNKPFRNVPCIIPQMHLKNIKKYMYTFINIYKRFGNFVYIIRKTQLPQPIKIK